QMETNLHDVVAAGKLGEVPGIGETLRDKITTLVTTGHLPFYEDLKKKVPPGIFQMLRVQGLGPKKAKALWEELGVDDLEKLKTACEAGQVAELKGCGAKTQQNIVEGIEFLTQMGTRVRIDQALPVALALLEELRKCRGVVRSELCGSLRRRKETIKDIDILISSDDPAPIMQRFVTLPEVIQVTGHGDNKSSVIVALGGASAQTLVLNADLRLHPGEPFPPGFHPFTRPKR